jgi:glycosyltransferase involved in cell wall biosynthesis
MACGVSVVAALHGGAAEIGEDGVHCLGHIPGDPNSLANAIQKLANDDVLRIRLCNKALEHVAKTFDANQNPTRWMSLMKEVICF